MIAQSQSGTGKTAAFVLAMLSRVDPAENFPQVIYFSQWLVSLILLVVLSVIRCVCF